MKKKSKRNANKKNPRFHEEEFYDDEELKRRGMFYTSRPTETLAGGGSKFGPIYKDAGGAGGRTLKSPEALIFMAESRDEMSRSGLRDRKLLRIREMSELRKKPKRR
jgi:hypothetical protein